jgi:lipoprotein NlpD
MWNGIRPPSYQIFPGQRLRLKPPETAYKRPKPVKQPSSAKPAKTTASQRTVPARQAPSSGKQKTTAKNNQVKTPQKPKQPLKLTWGWPTKGKVVQTFSRADSTRKGVWIAGAMGQPVKASAPGKVVYAGNGLVGYGNLVIIKHDRSYLSAYGYNSKLLVSEGDAVKKGDMVARMGIPNSSSQPMLHFEIRKQGKPVNPLPLLPRK